jgi:protein-disulfide isomerase
LTAVISVALPEALYEYYAAQESAPKDPIKEWRDAKVARLELNLQGGAFGDYSLGDPQAPIQIVEFADYECPACKMMHALMHRLLEQYRGSYFFVFKNYPLDQACNPEMERPLHQFACSAAFFSRCAGEQGKFWEANTLLFLRDADKGELSEASLISEGSKELGVDGDAIRQCMSSGRYREVISRDIKAGAAAGLFGTPSVWVNGKLVSQPSQQTFEAIFNSILKEKGMPTP